MNNLAGTAETRWPEIEAFIDTGIISAKNEGLNRLVKQVKSVRLRLPHVNDEHTTRR